MNFLDMYNANPTAVPNGNDRIAILKANGDPASYTLDQLAALTQSVSFAQWQTDAYHGVRARAVVDGDGQFSHSSGVVPFNTPLFDSGYYASSGTFVVPLNVAYIEVVSHISCVGATPVISVVKNNSTTLCRKTGVSGSVDIHSGTLAVNAGDSIQITLTGTTAVNESAETFLSIRTLEKLA